MKQPANNILNMIFTQNIERMSQLPGCLGAWHFGSISRGLDDSFSDVDVVFLIDSAYFAAIDGNLRHIFDESVNVLTMWPEGFNSDYFKNYGFLLEVDGTLKLNGAAGITKSSTAFQKSSKNGCCTTSLSLICKNSTNL